MHAARVGTDDPLALVQYLDLKTYLVGDINTKVDRASMAHSLEVREPLMDHPLVEWLATLPSSLKLHGPEGKWLLKKAMETANSAEPEAVRAALEKITGFVGVGGVFNFSETDHNGLDASALEMVQIEKGDWKIVK